MFESTLPPILVERFCCLISKVLCFSPMSAFFRRWRSPPTQPPPKLALIWCGTTTHTCDLGRTSCLLASCDALLCTTHTQFNNVKSQAPDNTVLLKNRNGQLYNVASNYTTRQDGFALYHNEIDKKPKVTTLDGVNFLSARNKSESERATRLTKLRFVS